MMTVDVAVDLDAFKTEMVVFANQIDFATAKAINYTAIAAQKDIRTHISETFTVRRKSFVDKAIKVKPFATKQNQSATVMVDPPGGEARDVLSQHEAGGSKTATDGHSIAIPTRNVQPDVQRVIPMAKRPRNLKDGVKIKSRDGHQFIVFSKGRGKNRKTLPAYRLVPKVTLKPTLQFEETALKTIEREWEKNFGRAWDEAIKTALK